MTQASLYLAFHLIMFCLFLHDAMRTAWSWSITIARLRELMMKEGHPNNVIHREIRAVKWNRGLFIVDVSAAVGCLAMTILMAFTLLKLNSL